MKTKHLRKINELIPEATKIAQKRVVELGKTVEIRMGCGGLYNHCFETEFFHQEMNRLTKEAGLRVL